MKKTYDKKEFLEKQRKEMDEITKKLEQGVKDVFSSDEFKKYLKFCARFPHYSVNNQLLILLQKPDATMCQGFKAWQKVNRHVKKDEHGIRILAYSPSKKIKEMDKLDADGNVVYGVNGKPEKERVEVEYKNFKPVSTFDISQTEGEPIPTYGVESVESSVDGYETLLDAVISTVPVPVAFENIESGAKGYYHLEDNRIVVQEGMSEAQTIKTILHEAAHQKLHSKEAMAESSEKKSRGQKETEAESVAFIVCQHFGIDTADYSFAYLAGWSEGKGTAELKASLDTIRDTALSFIKKIDEKLNITEELDEAV